MGWSYEGETGMARKMAEKKDFVIAMDFDDTLFTRSWPKRGRPRKDVIAKLKEFVKEGAQVALWTCREAGSLKEALERAREQGLRFDAVNDNVDFVKEWIERNVKANGGSFSQRKIWANMYVDDRSPGSVEAFLKMDARKTIAEA